jgi:hypothetical protein
LLSFILELQCCLIYVPFDLFLWNLAFVRLLLFHCSVKDIGTSLGAILSKHLKQLFGQLLGPYMVTGSLNSFGVTTIVFLSVHIFNSNDSKYLEE